MQQQTQPTRREALSVIRESGVIAILRAPDAERFEAVAEALHSAGITCIELTMTSRGALDALRRVRERLPEDVSLGVGTVLDVETVDAAVEAGAEYLIAPTVQDDVIARAREHGVPMIPGALTPTEILHAHRAGAAAVKVFPCGPVGGAAYVKALRGPLPDVPLIPTGGVSVDDVAALIAAGVVAVGLGAPLVGDAASSGGDLDGLRQRARRAVEAVREARGVAA